MYPICTAAAIRNALEVLSLALARDGNWFVDYAGDYVYIGAGQQEQHRFVDSITTGDDADPDGPYAYVSHIVISLQDRHAYIHIIIMRAGTDHR